MDVVLSIRGLFAGYDRGDILRGVNLDFERGAVTCVMGPNDAGKSSVLKVVSGLLRTRAGDRTRVEIAGAMIQDRRGGLMDEPSMGLDPEARRVVFQTIRQLNDAGATVLLVEQNARSGLEIAGRGAVMETGAVRLEGVAR